jgi:hypothetical protein
VLTLSRANNDVGCDLLVDIDAPFHGDASPSSAAGPTPGLWDFEVVELFLLGAGDRYLELEFGPHGHWLALQLEGRRNIVRTENSQRAVQFEAMRSAGRWRGTARIDASLLPDDLARANAYAMPAATSLPSLLRDRRPIFTGSSTSSPLTGRRFRSGGRPNKASKKHRAE